MAYTNKQRARVSGDIMWERLRELCPQIIEVKPMPSVDELQKRYKIRDVKDLKILYSVEMTDSVILVTYDDDFFDSVEGVTARIIRPADYLYEDESKGSEDVARG
jgi:predicted nucleic acid-binding protein